MSSVGSAVFARGSTTYFFASSFFSGKSRRDVTDLYAFVRVVDDCVDHVPPDRQLLAQITRAWVSVKKGLSVSAATAELPSGVGEIFTRFMTLSERVHFSDRWTAAFLLAMWLDLYKARYQTMDELKRYMYGSAEVIGLMMAQILGLGSAAWPTARLQGRSMQYVNFLRDIKEDLELGRQYIPKEITAAHGLTEWSAASLRRRPEVVSQLLRTELERYREWQRHAAVGYHYLPFRARVAVKTASDRYQWTAQQIAQSPLRVLEEKIKPSKWQVLGTGLLNTLWALKYGS